LPFINFGYTDPRDIIFAFWISLWVAQVRSALKNMIFTPPGRFLLSPFFCPGFLLLDLLKFPVFSPD